MNLEHFGEELKQLRLEKKISLMDISAETRINLKFLEAIERGQFHILPQTYVRAFLREYAVILGLNPDDMMQRYNRALQEVSPEKKNEPNTQHSKAHDQPVGIVSEHKVFTLSPLQRNITFGAFIIIAIALVVILANLNRESEVSKTVSEVPFDNVIHESEAASTSVTPFLIDSSYSVIKPQIDSLHLEMTSIDSVWISILIDGKKVEEYLFGPKRKRLWIAKERFSVTMGNAGGATFKLNDKEIGSLGRRGAVVRNTVITEANLKN